MRLTARFNGKCSSCGRQLPKGSEIEYIDKKAYCLGCGPDEPPVDLFAQSEAEQLADKLGFVDATSLGL